MRTLRLSLVGTVILVLLGGLGGTSVAQETEAPSFDEPYEVTGEAIHPRVQQFSEVTWDEERQIEESTMYSEQRIELDDPRLSGWLHRTWNIVTYGGPRHDGIGEVMTGTVQLVNDDGSWVGTERAYITTMPRWHYWQLELTGTGAYEGHSALLWTQGVSDGPIEVKGFLFPGSLPEYPPEPEVIIDPVEVVVAENDAVAGEPLIPAMRFVAAAEVGPDVFTEIREARWTTAVVDIPAGTPITSDLVKPAE